jgi:tRNA(adenine34) deaminase
MLATQEHEGWMKEALREAEKAYAAAEVPVGAVVISNDRVIGRGHNRVEALQDTTAHAEMLAITAASDTQGSWRLDDAFLYVTLEPCLMCAGAMQLARISRVIFGAPDKRFGACGSVYNVLQNPRANHHVDVVSGILVERCAGILTSFFKEVRSNS